MSRLLEGRRAVVTGAAHGVGLEVARALHEHGCRVVLAGVDGARAEAAAASLGDGAVGLACDVRLEADVESLVGAAVETLGGLDVFVNHAGITRDASLRRMSVDDFDAVVTVQLRGTWLGIRAASAVMRETGGGSIVNLSSISGKIGTAGQTNHSAATAGVVGMTKAAAKELGPHGVRVNAVAPGLIRTSLTAAMSPEAFAAAEATIPMRRAGEPHEVAGAVLFLASDLAGYVTGSVVEVSGGRGM